MGLYFRGHTYENTLYNRIVANFLTFLYRLKIELVYYIETYWLRFVLLVLLVVSLCACADEQSPLLSTISLPHVAPDTCVVDSQSVYGHDYLIFYRPAKGFGVDVHLEPFQVLHSPDCYCRYNRKFIVVSHSKK